MFTSLPLVIAHKFTVAKKANDVNSLVSNAICYLATPAQRDKLAERGLSVRDAITGGFGSDDEEYVYGILNYWNQQIGEDVFGYQPIPGDQD